MNVKGAKEKMRSLRSSSLIKEKNIEQGYALRIISHRLPQADLLTKGAKL